jgi:hypothetical protein
MKTILISFETILIEHRFLYHITKKQVLFHSYKKF